MATPVKGPSYQSPNHTFRTSVSSGRPVRREAECTIPSVLPGEIGVLICRDQLVTKSDGGIGRVDGPRPLPGPRFGDVIVRSLIDIGGDRDRWSWGATVVPR
ncbi:hypothetical protein GCM10023170_092230 [Phytohabitans houttuyneae]